VWQYFFGQKGLFTNGLCLGNFSLSKKMRLGFAIYIFAGFGKNIKFKMSQSRGNTQKCF
jgi:hypothetical protein